MTVRNYTTAEKLSVIENIIQHPSEGDEVEVLKAIAQDLRGRMNGAPSATLVGIERVVVAAARSRASPGHMIALAQETLRRWPTLKQSLELFGARAEERVNGS